MAGRWAAAGHYVLIGSRDSDKAVAKAREFNMSGPGDAEPIRAGGNREIVEDPEVGVVVLTVPFGAHDATVAELAAGGALDGKLIIDLTVPLAPPKITEVTLPEPAPVAARTQRIAGPKAQVAAALHHVSSAHLADPEAPIDCDVLVCADDEAARARAMALVEDLGLRAVDAGVLNNAVALESLTPVLLHINRRYKLKGAGLRITGLK